MKYRALTDLSLRKSSSPADEAYEEWYEWREGTVFEAPPHMDVERAIARGIIELVGGRRRKASKPEGGD